MTAYASRQPQDQADGLRRLFAHSQTRFLPVVSNPHMAFGGVMLERLCTALSLQGRRTLVVDAGERAPQPREWSALELADGIEPLSGDVAYLAARGLPLRFVDQQGSTAGFLQAAADAWPQADIVLVHASAVDLCRMFAHADRSRCAAPLVLADERPISVTHAYAAIKLLNQRGRQPVCDLLLSAGSTSPRAERIGQQLARCADEFVGAAVRECLHIDPAGSSSQSPAAAVQRWAGRIAACDAAALTTGTPPSAGTPSPVRRPCPMTLAYQATEAATALN